LLVDFLQELPGQNNAATMIPRRKGAFPTSRYAPASDLARTARSAILSLRIVTANQEDWNHG